MIEELKPCPFCGCEVGLVTGDEYFTVRGQHSMACVFLDDEPVATTEEWNTRAALKAGQGEVVACACPGLYCVKANETPPATADAVSVPRELLDEDGLDAIQEWAEGEDQTVNVGPVQGDFDEHIESTAGYAVRLMKELRALLAQSQEVKS